MTSAFVGIIIIIIITVSDNHGGRVVLTAQM